jgi:hypothetical protein
VTETYGTWGIHGVLRFFQGKGFVVTALVPLAVALTLRWFVRREKIDLIGLALCHVCAIGFTANGLYLTPLASALTAAAWLLTTRVQAWRETALTALWLVPTIVYPVIIAVVGALGHLYLPSEVIGKIDPFKAFRFVTGWREGGLVAIALLPLGSLGFSDPRLRIAVALFVPLALLLILNPIGWRVTSIVTGNLGFRFLWAIPAAILAGLALDGLCRHILGTRTTLGVAAALACLLVAIAYNASLSPRFRVTWDVPRLRVIAADYADALAVERLAPANCNILAPERVSVWLSTMPNAPYPVFVRSLYLKHYRFTMSAKDLKLRTSLFELEEGKAPAPMPTLPDLRAAGIAIGFIAAEAGTPAEGSAARLAAVLGLQDHGRLGDRLVYWRGSCGSMPTGRE